MSGPTKQQFILALMSVPDINLARTWIANLIYIEKMIKNKLFLGVQHNITRKIMKDDKKVPIQMSCFLEKKHPPLELLGD